MKTAVLLPLTLLSLVVAVAALGLRARRRRGFAPFAVGVVAAGVLVMGKFVMEPNAATATAVVYGGIVALVGASVWNSWPRRRGAVPPETLLHLGSDIKGLVMATKRTIDVFSAGCPACQDAVALVQRAACPSCEVTVLDMNDPQVANRAKRLGRLLRRARLG
jgi:hypothetical protein